MMHGQKNIKVFDGKYNRQGMSQRRRGSWNRVWLLGASYCADCRKGTFFYHGLAEEFVSAVW